MEVGSRYYEQHTRQASASHAHFWRVFPVWGSVVKYTKPALTFEQQADQLLSRGLIARFLDSSLLETIGPYVDWHGLIDNW
jgi:hypothetical protein